MLRVDFPNIYNPANQTEDELIANFVVRTALFRSIYDDIRNAEMKFPQMHYIIQGIRGQGKTTLLLRIAYEIRKNEELMQKVIPIVFNEDQYNISRLYKLWETTAHYLEESREIQGISKEMEDLDFDDDYEERCFGLLEDNLKKKNKKIILFIDNIDEIFDKLSEREYKRLREVFTQSAELRLIGTSSIFPEFHYDYSKPFFQFFKIVELKGLDPVETKTLLLKLGEQYKTERVKEIVEKEPGRVEALRRITGGVIRTIILLFGIFVDDINGSAFKDLERILDLVTPLYKHRMDRLSARQQEVVDFIALRWEAVAVKEIAKKTRMESKAVSSQLNQLEKYRIIEKEKTNTKNHLYRIHERFFNIWYLMRCGRKWDEKRVRFLVEFLSSWCDERELVKIARCHLRALKKGDMYDKQSLYVTETLARMPIQRKLQNKLIRETKFYLESCCSDLKEYLSYSDTELANEAKAAFRAEEWDKAIEKIEHIRNKIPYEFIIQSICYMNLGKHKNAEECLLKAVEMGDTDAMMGLALLNYDVYKNFSEAERYYLMAVENGHVDAMNNLALLYISEFNNFPKAEYYFLMAVENRNSRAMFNLALLYDTEFKDFSKAEQYYLMAVKKGYTNAMNRLAWNYFEQKIKKNEAIHFAEQSFLKEKSIYNSHTYAMILLWNNEIMKAFETACEFLSKPETFEKYTEDIGLFFILLMAKKQYHLTLKLFEENTNHLKDRYKPIYYALMYFLKDEYPNEYLKMGSELKETVEEIIKKIGEMEKDYE
jgi:TPR repeat protein